jgi:CBS domain-containing protein
MPLATMTRRTRLKGVRVRDLMTRNPVSVRHGITVREAAAFLAGRDIGAAPVVNDAGRAVGVLSLSDALLAVSTGVDGAPVREVMTPSVIAVRPEDSALDAVDAMIRHVVRRVFVADGDGVPVGVVSATDLFRALAPHCDRRSLNSPDTDSLHRTPPAGGTAMTERRTDPSAPVARDLMREVPVVAPLWMSVPAVAALLDAVGACVAPVVDADGRCVGVFTPAEYRRWLGHKIAPVEVFSEWQVVPEPVPDEVCWHMRWHIASAAPGAGLGELLYRMAEGPETFLVVLDNQRRPRGVVCALDVLVAEANLSRARSKPALKSGEYVVPGA